MHRCLALVGCATLLIHCGGSSSSPNAGAGGGGAGGASSAGGAGAAGAGAQSNAGTAGAAANAGAGSGVGGASGSAGGSATGGSSGQAGSSAGGGNSSTAGTGGSAGGAGQGGQSGGGSGGSAGSGGGNAGPAKSAGCGKAGRPPGGEVVVANDRIYDFPTSYDGAKPMPLVIALHGANNPNTILQTLSKGSKLETDFVRAFPKSNGNAWQYMGGTGADSKRIAAIYDELLANYCIDTNHVFLTGHSSGAQMAVQMMCAAGGDKRFKAYAPVAASKYCDTMTPAPVLYIQGQMDAQRGNSNGANVVAVFTASNHCSAATSPVVGVQACNSTFNNKPVDPGCISYDGCSDATVWCSHNDDGYNATDGHQHGWPCFASNAIADFFSSFP